MKKIVYVMNVDWNWIKQRPHFLAQELAKDNDVTVMYQHRYNRQGHQKRAAEGLNLHPIYVIPRGDRVNFLRNINRHIKKMSIQHQVKASKADILYLTFPDQVGAIPSAFTGKVIYDCMDNHPAFLTDMDARKEMENQEAALMERADHVLVSSQKLTQVLLERYGSKYSHKLTLVRNGYNGNVMPVENAAVNKQEEKYTIAYFGTISSWFNFEFLLKSLEEFPNLNYLLMGPAEVPIPKVPRLEYIGTVEHKELGNAIADAQCLMMPFVVNEIIESVDPVKLYEYINFNRNILCVRYPEVERFEPFAHFYTDYTSFRTQIEQLLNRSNVKYTLEQRNALLQQSSWTERANTIRKLF